MSDIRRKVLILSTATMEPLNDVVVAAQAALPQVDVEVVDLTVEHPDYAALVDKVFASESVQVW